MTFISRLRLDATGLRALPPASKIKPLLNLAIFASLLPLSACLYDDEPPRRLSGADPAYASDPAPPASSAPAPSAPPTTAPTTMLVEVDTDQTMNAVGGEGVGVFVEYAKGGRWHVWWTCDTNQTQQSCNFAVSVSSAAGKLTNVDSSELAGGFVTAATPARLDATSTVVTEVRGLRFDAPAGMPITLEASVGGLKDGSFLFFVQNGRVNGGFAGKLTNPLQLQGSTP